MITTGEGGMVTTNEEGISKKIRKFISHGIEKDRNRFTQENLPPWSYEQQDLGYNYRMNDIEAALGLSQLESLDSFREK